MTRPFREMGELLFFNILGTGDEWILARSERVAGTMRDGVLLATYGLGNDSRLRRQASS